MSALNTREVRRVFALAPVNLADCEHVNDTPDYAAKLFDKWLAEHDRKIAAAAWDAAVAAIVHEDGTPVNVSVNKNPYKETQ